MTERYEIRVYRPGDEHRIVPSFNRVFREVCGPGYVDRTLDFWRWEFEHNPCGHRITVGLTESGEIAAQYAGIAQRVATSFGPMTFVHIVDSFVLPEHRAGLKRPGLFVTTAYPWFELCRERGDAVLYGYPVATAERIGQRYLEYKFLRVVDYLCRPASAGTTSVPAAVQVERCREIPDDVDALFGRMAERRRCLVVRDREYLDWRYLRMPGDAYEVHAARRDGALVGLIVLRPRHELVPDACSIADWLTAADDADVTDALLGCVTARARAHSRETVLAVFADSSPERRALVERGFEVAPSSRWLERRLTHRIYDERLSTEWLSEHWWYTLGDSDLI